MTLAIRQNLEETRPPRFRDLAGNKNTVNLIYRLVARNAVPKGVFFYGGWGCGKTSSARNLAKIVSCHNLSPQTLDPCGGCPHCGKAMLGLSFDGGVLERNAADLSLSQLQDIAETAREPTTDPRVVIIDEMQRATAPIQDLLLSLLEDETLRFFLFFCAPDISNIQRPLLDRVISFKLEAPTTDEMIENMKGICERFGWSHEEGVLRRIAEANENVPRRCHNALFTMSLQNSL